MPSNAFKNSLVSLFVLISFHSSSHSLYTRPQCVAGNGEEVQADLSQNEIGNVAITNAAVDTTDGTATNAGEGDASTTEPSLANEINVDVGDDDNKVSTAVLIN